jgi:hypothetical protein
MISTVKHILPLTTIRRERNLPIGGAVIVRTGEEVEAEDIIAEANLSPKFTTINLALALDINPADVKKFLKREVGEVLSAGTIIARKGRRIVPIPDNCKFISINNEIVLLELESEPYQLIARVPGEIVQIQADYGVIIETKGAWVQGIWGNGHVKTGLLKNLAESPDMVLLAKHIKSDLKGCVMLAGRVNNKKPLDKISSIKGAGLIVGSLSAKLIRVAEEKEYPIMILEGFGEIPINKAAYNLLSTNIDRVTTLNAQILDRKTGEFPEVFIPLRGAITANLAGNLAYFSEGQLVRICKNPAMGKIGEVLEVFSQPQRFPSGIKVPAAKVQFDEETMLVPLANIEVLG